MRAILTGLLFLGLSSLGWADVFTFDQSGSYTISATDTQYEGHDLVIAHASAVITIEGTHSFNLVDLRQGAVIQHGNVSIGTFTNTTNYTTGHWQQGGYELSIASLTFKKGKLTSGQKPTLLNDVLAVNDFTYIATQPQQWQSITVSGTGKVTSIPGVFLSLTADSISLQDNATIDVSGQGVENRAVLSGPNTAMARIGGTHAGLGGGYGDADALPPYGDLYHPSSFGEGGVNSSGTGSGLGGGALYLNAGTLTLQNSSKILADAASVSTNSGGSAGGSIWIETAVLNLSTSAVISAKGSNGYYGGSGGGGGRVAIYYGQSVGVDPITRLNLSAGNFSVSGEFGQAGIAYLEDAGGYKTVVHHHYASVDVAHQPVTLSPIVGIDRYVLIRVPAQISGDFSAATISAQDAEIIQTGDVSLGTLERISGSGSVWNQSSHGLTIQNQLLWQSSELISAIKPVLPSGDILAVNGFTYRLAAPQQWQEVTVENAGTITTVQGQALDLQAQRIVISGSTSKIDVSDMGTVHRSAIESAYYDSAFVSVARLGGSHGGIGGAVGSTQAGAVYGSETQPVTLGEGGIASNGAATTYAGGAARIRADELVLNGPIKVDGNVSGNSSYGGDAGGSLWIEAGVLSGSANISANGSGSSYASGGGGGRVALYYAHLDGFNPTTQVFANGGNGSASYNPGAPGTIHVEQADASLYVVRVEEGTFFNQPIDRVSLRFSRTVDPATLNVAAVSLQGASVSAVNQISDTLFEVVFSAALPEGSYLLTLASSVATPSGNLLDQDRDLTEGEAGQDEFSAVLTVDVQAPAAPTVNYALLPEVHYLSQTSVTLQGTREEGSAVYINGAQRVPAGGLSWTYQYTLSTAASGVNNLSITAVDAAGNASAAVELSIVRDTLAPNPSSMSPSGAVNVVPTVLLINYYENGSGLVMSESSAVLTRQGIAVPGQFNLESATQLSFTPAVALIQGQYSLSVTLADRAGNQRTVAHSLVIDTTPPAAPTVNAYPAVTTNATITLSGGKEAGAGIKANGVQKVYPGSGTSWSYNQTLVEGVNEFSLQAFDPAGNHSDPVTVTIRYDNTAPGPVTLLRERQDVSRTGTDILLDWLNYLPAENGSDIAEYRIYIETGAFFDVDLGLAPKLVVPGFSVDRTALLQGLVRSQTIYVAVVAVDFEGQYENIVTPLDLLPVDILPPANVTDLAVVSDLTSLGLGWTASASTDGDLDEYRIYAGETLVASTQDTSITLPGLQPETRYDIKVRSRDLSGNESTGVTDPGVTLLNNPTGLSASPLSAKASLIWSASAAGLVSNYRIYAETTPFSSVAGMTPKLTINGGLTAATLAGLENGVEYHIAVTAVNLSGGENPAVTTVAVTPEADVDGPTLSNIKYGTSTLVNGLVLDANNSITLTATDESGVGSIAFDLGETRLGTDFGAPFAQPVNLSTIDDGAYTLTITASDSIGNTTTESFAVTVALNAPAMPVISYPGNNSTLNITDIAATGSTVAGAEVTLYVDSVAQGTVQADTQGLWRGDLVLPVGESVVSASARFPGRSSESAQRNHSVTVDLSVPKAPTALTAIAKAAREVQLSWSSPVDPVAGYHVYRAEAPFETVAEASRITTVPFTGNRYLDTPSQDARYYYRVVSVNVAGTESVPTNQVHADADGTQPVLETLQLTTNGPSIAEPLTFARGQVSLLATWSEPLLARPYLAISPNGGVPLVVKLTAVPGSDRAYTGSFEITEFTPGGLARVVMSAIDRAGNHGSVVAQYDTFLIDAQGPEIISLQLMPASPIDNNPDPEIGLHEVVVVIETSKATAELPTLIPQLDGAVIDGLSQGITLTAEASVNDAERWSGSFLLPADAGLSGSNEPIAQALSFSWSAVDALQNTSTRIRVEQDFQVYQGDLPPLAVPQNLIGKAVGGGVIELSWSTVEDAAGYRIFRKAPGDATLTAITDTEGEEASFTDDGQHGHLNAAGTGLLDGSYQYSVASLRKANGETAASGQSNVVTVQADATAPDAPANLQASLDGRGATLVWEYALPLESGLQFQVYRHHSEVTDIAELEGVTPLITNLGSVQYLDTRPTGDARYYYVLAQDAAGNRSALSNVAYMNAALLPVRDLVLSQHQGGHVQLSWHYDLAAAEGFNVRAGRADALVQLNGNELITAAANPVTYIDDKILLDEQGFAVRDRLYRVEARDDENTASPVRDVTLPAVSVALTGVVDENGNAIEQALKVGVFNRILVAVHNRGDQVLNGATVTVSFDQYENEQWVPRNYLSEPFTIGPGEQRNVPVVVGGISNPLTSSTEVTAKLEHKALSGERIVISSEAVLPVNDAAYVADLRVENLVADAQGNVRIYLENTTDLPIDIVLAENYGNRASRDVRIFVQDEDRNTLTITPVQLFTGDGVVTKADGNTVARIEPGMAFVSAPIAVSLANVQQDQVRLVLVVDKLYYNYGELTEITTTGLTASRQAATEQPPYQGELLSISPETADLFGIATLDITLTGRALNSAQDAVANAPLDLVFGIKGFERKFPVTTDAAGEFVFTFPPTLSDAGVYTVSVVYPGSSARPQHGTFEVRGASLTPNNIKATWPKNYPNTFEVKVSSSADTVLENVTVQIPANLPAGITVTPPAPVDVPAGGKVTLPIGFAALGSAETSNVIELPVVFGDGSQSLGTIYIDYTLTEAKPVLTTTPGFVETGMAQGERLTQTLTVKNTGFDTALNVTATLEGENGAPAPEWARVAESTGLGDIAAGSTAALNLVFTPDTNVVDGGYVMTLKLKADNVPVQTRAVYVAVVQEGSGNALFHVSDIYTATLDEQGNPILGLQDATVKIQNANVLEQTHTLNTNNEGYLTFEGIPPGRYYYHVSASGHESKSGSFWIRPGVTVSEEVFLMNQLVTVSWSVEEITIRDEYRVILTATYKTFVPAPVIALEPKTVRLPDLRKGEVFYGELRLSNLGMIRGYNVRQSLPGANDWYQIEFLRTPPDALEPSQVVTLPYRVTALRSFDGTVEGYDTGGSCVGPPSASTSVQCNGECANGEEVAVTDSSQFAPPSTDRQCAISSSPVHVGTGGGSGGTGTGWGGWGSGGGGWIGGSKGGCGDGPPDQCPPPGGGG